MTWFKVDDGFHSHPKILAAGNAAAGLFCRFGSYCSQHITDGFVPEIVAKTYGKRSEIARLLELGLIEPAACGYLIPDFLDFNPSAEKVRAARDDAAERQRRHREHSRQSRSDGPVTHAVSHGTPSRPVPSRPDRTQLATSSSVVQTAPDDDDLYESVLDLVVEAKIAGKRMDNPKAYRHATRLNTHLEDEGLIRDELACGSDAEHAALLVLSWGTEAAKEREAVPWCTEDCAECDGEGWIWSPQGLSPCPRRA